MRPTLTASPHTDPKEKALSGVVAIINGGNLLCERALALPAGWDRRGKEIAGEVSANTDQHTDQRQNVACHALWA